MDKRGRKLSATKGTREHVRKMPCRGGALLSVLLAQGAQRISPEIANFEEVSLRNTTNVSMYYEQGS